MKSIHTQSEFPQVTRWTWRDAVSLSLQHAGRTLVVVVGLTLLTLSPLASSVATAGVMNLPGIAQIHETQNSALSLKGPFDPCVGAPIPC